MNTKRAWYSSNPNVKSPDTIHQILMFGTLDEAKSLKKIIGKDMLKKLFLAYPKKIYTASALNFIKKFILDIQAPFDEQKYLKYTDRHIG